MIIIIRINNPDLPKVVSRLFFGSHQGNSPALAGQSVCGNQVSKGMGKVEVKRCTTGICPDIETAGHALGHCLGSTAGFWNAESKRFGLQQRYQSSLGRAVLLKRGISVFPLSLQSVNSVLENSQTL